MRMRGFDSATSAPKALPPEAAAAAAPPPHTSATPAATVHNTQLLPPITPAPHKASSPQAVPPIWKGPSVPKAPVKSLQLLGNGHSSNPAAREAMRPPKYGGYSKRDQLGSVQDSWGTEDTVDDGVLRLGLFQVEPEPPSPPATPFP